MDFIRHLLGLDSVTYMGYSYGTWLGTWYGSVFAENIERMVLDSAVDSTRPSLQTLYDVAHEGRDRQFRLHLMNWMARNDAVFALGNDPEAIWDRYFAATESDEMAQTARYTWNSSGAILGFSSGVAYPITGALVAALIAEGESGADGDPAEAAARIIEQLGLPEPQLTTARATLAGLTAPQEPETIDGVATATYSEVIDFTKCTDGQWEQGLEYWEDFNERTARVAPLSAQLGLLDTPQACAFWPTDSSMPEIGDDFPETILLQGELDSMTPFEQGYAAAAGLPNTSLIAVDNESRHGIFPYGTEAVDAPVVAFLLGGARPSETIVAPGQPLPFEQSTFESWTPLDGDGDHADDEPRFTDPLAPAETAELVAGPAAGS
jgi:pimeloyl-ACP methyl ester carboxylesterase